MNSRITLDIATGLALAGEDTIGRVGTAEVQFGYVDPRGDKRIREPGDENDDPEPEDTTYARIPQLALQLQLVSDDPLCVATIAAHLA